MFDLTWVFSNFIYDFKNKKFVCIYISYLYLVCFKLDGIK